MWKELEADPGFQARIRGLAVLSRGISHALPVPSCFSRVTYIVDLGADQNGTPASFRVGYVADDVTVTFTVYARDQKVTRLDVRRTGRLRYRP
jgi:hypothetical protein